MKLIDQEGEVLFYAYHYQNKKEAFQPKQQTKNAPFIQLKRSYYDGESEGN